MSKVITFVSMKGGTSKTSSSTALTSILTERGYKTLLLDCDAQCNSTDTFRALTEGVATIYDVLLEEKRIKLSDAIQRTECGEVVAGDPLLRTADDKLKNDVEGPYRLLEALENFEGYDYVIIDTAPAMNSILHNCLIAADEVVIPMTSDRYSIQGLMQLNDTIRAIRRRQNPKIKIAGFLLTKFNGRTNLSKEVRDTLAELAVCMETKIFDTPIRECIKVREAQAQKRTLISYAPNCTAAEDYKRFADELIHGW